MEENAAISYLRLNRNTLYDFTKLGEKEDILLFTPAVPTLKETPENLDPFEFFGLALTRYHKRVRHIPYLPSQGFTRYHEEFLEYASAVVVVAAEPGVADKKDFLPNVLDRAVPAVLVVIANAVSKRDIPGGDFGVAVQASRYSEHCLTRLAAAIFDYESGEVSA